MPQKGYIYIERERECLLIVTEDIMNQNSSLKAFIAYLWDEARGRCVYVYLQCSINSSLVEIGPCFCGVTDTLWTNSAGDGGYVFS